MADANAKLVLASASPRRLALLEKAGLHVDLLNPADIDETPRNRETPRILSIRLAEEKGREVLNAPRVQALGSGVYVVSADTVVGLGRRILPKAETQEEALHCLSLLSGRAHWVYSTVVVISPSHRSFSRCVETKVRFKRLSRADIEAYLASDDWRGKAGGYAIQGKAEGFVRYIAGSYSSVVGLPIYETLHLLEGAGYPVAKRWNHSE